MEVTLTISPPKTSPPNHRSSPKLSSARGKTFCKLDNNKKLPHSKSWAKDTNQKWNGGSPNLMPALKVSRLPLNGLSAQGAITTLLRKSREASL